MTYLIILAAFIIGVLIGIRIKKHIELPTVTTTTTQSMDCTITGSATQNDLKNKAKK